MTAWDDNQGIPGDQAEALLRLLAEWGNTTTVIVHGGCVFEFKGAFPAGSLGEGYYNLAGGSSGLHGHINLGRIRQVAFQARPHRGRESYAFVFLDKDNEPIFKVFLGRDNDGALFPDQVAKFHRIKEHRSVQ